MNIRKSKGLPYFVDLESSYGWPPIEMVHFLIFCYKVGFFFLSLTTTKTTTNYLESNLLKQMSSYANYLMLQVQKNLDISNSLWGPVRVNSKQRHGIKTTTSAKWNDDEQQKDSVKMEICGVVLHGLKQWCGNLTKWQGLKFRPGTCTPLPL